MKLATNAAAVEALECRQFLAGDGFSLTIPLDRFSASAAVAVTPDNKILVAQLGQLVRYNPDGTADLTFGGGDAIVELNVPGMPTIVDMEVDATGRIYIAGITGASNAYFAVVRLSADGSADNSFGTNALALADFTPASKGSEVVQDLAVSPAGRVALVGEDGRGSAVLAVFNSTGQLDNTFDGDGKLVWGMRTDSSSQVGEVTWTSAVMYEAAAVDFAPDGRIVVGGWSTISYFAPVGVNIDFDSDLRWQLRSFSSTGQQIWSKSDKVNQNSAIRIVDLDVLTDGSILVAGESIGSSIRKLAADGTVDANFAGSPTGIPVNARDLAAAPDGSFYLLAAGDIASIGGSYEARDVWRFSPEGQLDSDFAPRRIGTAPHGGFDLAVLGDDAVVLTIQRDVIIVSPPQPATIKLDRLDADSAGQKVYIDKKGTLKIVGGDDQDAIHIHGRNDGRTVVTVNGLFKSFDTSDIKRVQIYGFWGNDKIDVGNRVGGVYIEGGEGDDGIVGGYDNDTIVGGSGADTLNGNFGDDLIVGNGGRDKLWGAEGKDTLYGQGGIDTLSGDSGDDFFSGGLDTRDNLYGGDGADADADSDARDNRLSVELSVINYANE